MTRHREAKLEAEPSVRESRSERTAEEVRDRRSRPLGGHIAGLDGLRGVGMSWMLAYHAEFAWAQGAFLALSQFFTLSGFLVAGILLDERRRSGNIDLRRFWTRRFRRLAPAAILALFGIVLFGAFAAEPSQVEALPRQVFAASVYLANWEFVNSDVSYGAMFEAPSPVQHFWSLSLEEQFYLFMPLAILGLTAVLRSWRALAVAFVTMTVLSAVWTRHLFGDGDNFDRVYYGTDTRLAEIIVGALLALVYMRRPLRSPRLRSVLASVGAVVYLGSIWMFHAVPIDHPWMWRGGMLVFALATAVVISGILTGEGPLRILSWKPVAVAGRLSYGLYLFHWPIFLWLSEQRTGLDPWPLFGLRVAVTVLLAAASYRFVEMPIRRGASLGLPAMARVGAVPVLSVALLAGSLAVAGVRSGEEQRTFGEEELTAPPEVLGDPVLDVLVISDPRGAAVAQELQRRSDEGEDLVVTLASPFECRSLVESEAGTVCAEWAEEWPALVERHDPDAVLFYVDRWPEEELRGLGAGDPQDTARELLIAGFTILGERGAPVVWATTPPTFEEALRLTRDPFHRAMLELRRLYPDLSRIRDMPATDDPLDPDFASEAADAVLAGLGTYRRRPSDGGRVLVMGDSQAQSVAYGLERWSALNGGPAVWNAGVGGCGVVGGGEVIGLVSGNEEPADPNCEGLVSQWLEGATSFEPDRVLVLTSLRDLQPRRLDGWTDFSAVGDAELDAHIVDSYALLAERFEALGAEVVWLVPPCVRPTIGGHTGPGSPLEPSAMDHLREVLLPRLAEEHPSVELYDVGEILCPGGVFLDEVDGVGQIRPDGLHLTTTSSAWLAELIGHDLLDLEG